MTLQSNPVKTETEKYIYWNKNMGEFLKLNKKNIIFFNGKKKKKLEVKIMYSNEKILLLLLINL